MTKEEIKQFLNKLDSNLLIKETADGLTFSQGNRSCTLYWKPEQAGTFWMAAWSNGGIISAHPLEESKIAGFLPTTVEWWLEHFVKCVKGLKKF